MNKKICKVCQGRNINCLGEIKIVGVVYGECELCGYRGDSSYIELCSFPDETTLFGPEIHPTDTMRYCLWLCVQYYGSNLCGGNLHSILDDDNVEDIDLDYGEKYCYVNGDLEGLKIIKWMRKIPVEDRIWVTYNICSAQEGYLKTVCREIMV